jgi:hypothetical protein
MNRSGGNTQVENVLILLMETGGFYCAFWVRPLSFFLSFQLLTSRQILLMVGDYGYYGPDFDFEWFQPYISVRVSVLLIRVQSVDEASRAYTPRLSFSWFHGR